MEGGEVEEDVGAGVRGDGDGARGQGQRRPGTSAMRGRQRAAGGEGGAAGCAVAEEVAGGKSEPLLRQSNRTGCGAGPRGDSRGGGRAGAGVSEHEEVRMRPTRGIDEGGEQCELKGNKESGKHGDWREVKAGQTGPVSGYTAEWVGDDGHKGGKGARGKGTLP